MQDRLSPQNPFTKAFLHLDGDSFFAACEVALNPSLRGKPVVTGLEKGIASAMTYEAKARGVTRGMRLFEIRKICPEAVIVSSDYETYSIFSERMYNIVRRYAPDVEEYSIDECFADITAIVKRIYEKGGGPEDVRAFALRIKEDLYRELGITFSVGIGSSKVLAKVGSKMNKPNGLYIITPHSIKESLAQVPIEKVWGIGPSTSVRLWKYGIRTALQFIQKEEWWVEEHLSKPYVELWHELRGNAIFTIARKEDHEYKSLSRTRMFTPPTKEKSYIFSELSKNIEDVCVRARGYGLSSAAVSYYLKTQDFRYHSFEIRLGEAINTPDVILSAVKRTFDGVYRPETLYRATGVTLYALREGTHVQGDLFGNIKKINKMSGVYQTVDEISRMYGRHSVFLASSLQAWQAREGGDGEREAYVRGGVGRSGHLLTKGGKQLCIPLMGAVV